MFDGLHNAYQSMELIFFHKPEAFSCLKKNKARHVCTGIGQRLPIIDSFPSLLGGLHIGPILVATVALLVANEEETGHSGQIVSVSSLRSPEGKRETQ